LKVIIVQNGTTERRASLDRHDDDWCGLDQRALGDWLAREDAAALCRILADLNSVG